MRPLIENSAAWTCCKLTYLETEDDVNTFNEALNAMMRWMYATEYLIRTNAATFLLRNYLAN